MIIRDKRIYKIIKEQGKERNKVKRSFFAFLFGGFLGLISQLGFELFNKYTTLEENIISTLVISILVFIAFILTVIGVYDTLANIFGAGLFIPITGFSNAITSSALEGKSEGLIFGIGGKMFSLIGSVFAYGIVSSIILGIIYYFVWIGKNG